MTYQFIRNNPAMTIPEITRAIQVSQPIITAVRNRLRREGFLPDLKQKVVEVDRERMAERTFSSPPTDRPPIEISDHLMGPDELAKILSKKLRGAKKIDEIKPLAEALIKMMPKSETSEEIGPGPPAEDDERIQRLGYALRAVGPDLSGRALEWARSNPIPAEGTVPLEQLNEDSQDQVSDCSS
jgi:hypothetical protein